MIRGSQPAIHDYKRRLKVAMRCFISVFTLVHCIELATAYQAPEMK